MAHRDSRNFHPDQYCCSLHLNNFTNVIENEKVKEAITDTSVAIVFI